MLQGDEQPILDVLNVNGQPQTLPVPMTLLKVQYIREGGSIYKVLVPQDKCNNEEVEESITPDEQQDPVNPVICQVQDLNDFKERGVNDQLDLPRFTSFLDLSSQFQSIKSTERLRTRTDRLGKKIVIPDSSVSPPHVKINCISSNVHNPVRPVKSEFLSNEGVHFSSTKSTQFFLNNKQILENVLTSVELPQIITHQFLTEEANEVKKSTFDLKNKSQILSCTQPHGTVPSVMTTCNPESKLTRVCKPRRIELNLKKLSELNQDTSLFVSEEIEQRIQEKCLPKKMKHYKLRSSCTNYEELSDVCDDNQKLNMKLKSSTGKQKESEVLLNLEKPILYNNTVQNLKFKTISTPKMKDCTTISDLMLLTDDSTTKHLTHFGKPNNTVLLNEKGTVPNIDHTICEVQNQVLLPSSFKRKLACNNIPHKKSTTWSSDTRNRTNNSLPKTSFSTRDEKSHHQTIEQVSVKQLNNTYKIGGDVIGESNIRKITCNRIVDKTAHHKDKEVTTFSPTVVKLASRQSKPHAPNNMQKNNKETAAQMRLRVVNAFKENASKVVPSVSLLTSSTAHCGKIKLTNDSCEEKLCKESSKMSSIVSNIAHPSQYCHQKLSPEKDCRITEDGIFEMDGSEQCPSQFGHQKLSPEKECLIIEDGIFEMVEPDQSPSQHCHQTLSPEKDCGIIEDGCFEVDGSEQCPSQFGHQKLSPEKDCQIIIDGSFEMDESEQRPSQHCHKRNSPEKECRIIEDGILEMDGPEHMDVFPTEFNGLNRASEINYLPRQDLKMSTEIEPEVVSDTCGPIFLSDKNKHNHLSEPINISIVPQKEHKEVYPKEQPLLRENSASEIDKTILNLDSKGIEDLSLKTSISQSELEGISLTTVSPALSPNQSLFKSIDTTCNLKFMVPDTITVNSTLLSNLNKVSTVSSSHFIKKFSLARLSSTQSSYPISPLEVYPDRKATNRVFEIPGTKRNHEECIKLKNEADVKYKVNEMSTSTFMERRISILRKVVKRPLILNQSPTKILKQCPSEKPHFEPDISSQVPMTENQFDSEAHKTKLSKQDTPLSQKLPRKLGNVSKKRKNLHLKHQSSFQTPTSFPACKQNCLSKRTTLKKVTKLPVCPSASGLSEVPQSSSNISKSSSDESENSSDVSDLELVNTKLTHVKYSRKAGTTYQKQEIESSSSSSDVESHKCMAIELKSQYQRKKGSCNRKLNNNMQSELKNIKDLIKFHNKKARKHKQRNYLRKMLTLVKPCVVKLHDIRLRESTGNESDSRNTATDLSRNDHSIQTKGSTCIPDENVYVQSICRTTKNETINDVLEMKDEVSNQFCEGNTTPTPVMQFEFQEMSNEIKGSLQISGLSTEDISLSEFFNASADCKETSLKNFVLKSPSSMILSVMEATSRKIKIEPNEQAIDCDMTSTFRTGDSRKEYVMSEVRTKPLTLNKEIRAPVPNSSMTDHSVVLKCDVDNEDLHEESTRRQIVVSSKSSSEGQFDTIEECNSPGQLLTSSQNICTKEPENDQKHPQVSDEKYGVGEEQCEKVSEKKSGDTDFSPLKYANLLKLLEEKTLLLESYRKKYVK